MSTGFAEFLIASIVMELTPGPNMVWLALLAARQGRRAGFIAVAGIASGLGLLALASATGVAALIATYPVIYEAIRWAGVLFLLYLAFEAWTGERATARSDDTRRHFRRGVVVNLLNPKAATVFVVLIPGFAGGPAATISGVAVMSAVYLAIATAAHMLIVTFAGSFQRFLSDPQREQAARRIFAVMLAGVAIWFALTSGRQAG
jgi:threonine/homoserine/homoserine lactone efflux protein